MTMGRTKWTSWTTWTEWTQWTRRPTRRGTLGVWVALVAVVVLSDGCSLVGRRPAADDDATYIEARFLIPIVSNSGSAFEKSRFQWVEDELTRRFGGYTLEGVFEGAYLDNGRIVREKSRRYLVAVPRDRLDELKEFLREVKSRFGQKSLYVSIAESQALFL